MILVERDDHKHSALPDINEVVDNYELEELDIDPNITDPHRPRRFSVSAESTDDKKTRFIKKLYPKSCQAMKRIENAVQCVFLFAGLDREQSKLLVDSMFEKRVRKGEDIITQGDRGDYFYVIEEGMYEVWKSTEVFTHESMHVKNHNRRNSYSNSSFMSKPKKVFVYKNKGSFGELALMYNAPRAATVKSTSAGVLWAVDRKTFRHIIMNSNVRKQKKYDLFLKNVDLFHNCSDGLRAAIADVIETKVYFKNECIISEGEIADYFYIIEKGNAVVLINCEMQSQCKHKNNNGNNKQIVRRLSRGDFFGERGLLLNDFRSADVIVFSGKLECAVMDKCSFLRLLSPMYDKFRQQINSYIINSNHTSDSDDGNLSDID